MGKKIGPHWVVWCEFGSLVDKEIAYPSEEEAVKKAKALACKYPGYNFSVMRSVKVVAHDAPVNVYEVAP